jgi:hypothetical protein
MIILTTSSHPEANGRQPEEGEPEYCLQFTLDDGTAVTVRMGQSEWETITDSMMDILSGAPLCDDGGIEKNI